MKRVLVAAVLSLLCLSPAFAETLRASLSDGTVMQVSDVPCKNGKVLLVVEKAFAMYGNGQKPPPLAEGWMEAPGQPRKHGCWNLNRALNVVIVYEDGSAGVLSLFAFAPVPEVKI